MREFYRTDLKKTPQIVQYVCKELIVSQSCLGLCPSEMQSLLVDRKEEKPLF